MSLSKGVLYAGLASAILFAVSAPAKASGILVTSDSGHGFVDATGTASGAMLPAEAGATIIEVNGTAVSLSLGIAENVTGFTSVGGVDMITSGTGTKIISDGTNTVRLELRITSGITSLGVLNVNATIISATGSNDVGGYNFYNLINGTTAISDTKTGFDFTTLLGHPGVTAPHGVLGVSEAVPEPTSMALLGVGMAGFFAFRRFFKRHTTA